VSEAPAFVYLLWCGPAPRSLYCGWTTDLERRLAAHQLGRGGRYTRARQPVTLAAVLPMASATSARQEEARIKRLTRAQKLALVALHQDSITPGPSRAA
jgi:putative endonuclease